MCNNCKDKAQELEIDLEKEDMPDDKVGIVRRFVVMFSGYRSAIVLGSAIALAIHSGNFHMAWAFMLQAAFFIGVWRISPVPEFISFMGWDIALTLGILFMALKHLAFTGIIPASVWSMVALETSVLVIIGGYVAKSIIGMREELIRLKNPEQAKKDKEEILEILQKTREIISMIDSKKK